MKTQLQTLNIKQEENILVFRLFWFLIIPPFSSQYASLVKCLDRHL